MGGCCSGDEDKFTKDDRNKVDKEQDKGRELEDILSQYGKAVREWQEKQQNQTNLKQAESKESSEPELIPSNARNIILILGQMLLPDASPHKWMLQRCEAASKLIESKNLDINNTYFVVSGSDVSNQKYTYNEKYTKTYTNKPHPCEADVMKKLLIKSNIPSVNIIRDPFARTTLENAYYFLKLMFESGFFFENQGMNNDDKYYLDNVFIVTSDWHLKRIKFNMDALFSIEREVNVDKENKNFDEKTGIEYIIRTYEIRKWFKSNNIEYVGVPSGAKQARFDSEVSLLKSKFLKPQAKEYCDYLWKWKDLNLSKMGKYNDNDAINRTETMELFAKSTAIEHMYLKLNNAREGLVKVAPAEEDDFWDKLFDGNESDSDSDYVKYADT